MTPVGADVRNVKQADAGLLLADTVRKYMYDLKVDDGLQAFGYTSSDIPALVKGTLPQVWERRGICCAMSLTAAFEDPRFR